MGPLDVVEVQIPAERCAGLGDAVIGLEIDFLVFDRAPEPFDEDVVAPGAFAVHADRDSVVGQQAGEGGAGELAAWSVLKISGAPCLARASSTASMQKSASMLIDTRQDKTRRVNQSITAAR